MTISENLQTSKIIYLRYACDICIPEASIYLFTNYELENVINDVKNCEQKPWVM